MRSSHCAAVVSKKTRCIRFCQRTASRLRRISKRSQSPAKRTIHNHLLVFNRRRVVTYLPTTIARHGGVRRHNDVPMQQRFVSLNCRRAPFLFRCPFEFCFAARIPTVAARCICSCRIPSTAHSTCGRAKNSGEMCLLSVIADGSADDVDDGNQPTNRRCQKPHLSRRARLLFHMVTGDQRS